MSATIPRHIRAGEDVASHNISRGRARARKLAARAALTGVAIVGVTTYAEASHHSHESTIHHQSVAALESVKSVKKGSIVIKPGANIRRSPVVEDTQPVNGYLLGSVNNKTDLGGENKYMLVNHAVNGPDGWIGFLDPKADRNAITSKDDLADEMRWVKADETFSDGSPVASSLDGVTGNAKAFVLSKGEIATQSINPASTASAVELSSQQFTQLAQAGLLGSQ